MKQKLITSDIVERDPEVFAAAAGRDVVMVRIASGSYYGVSDVAQEIWKALERPTRVSDLIASLSMAYDVDETTCEAETLAFLETLLSENLLRVTDGSHQ